MNTFPLTRGMHLPRPRPAAAEPAGVLSRRRVAELEAKMWHSYRVLEAALTVTRRTHRVTAVVWLFSGGNDSATLGHLFGRVNPSLTLAVHANTGIGIEATRVHVRQTCQDWNLPLLELHPPAGSTYRDLVLAEGFPAPARHYLMYQRLKERALHQARNLLVTDPRKERVIFLAGRRRTESLRRRKVPTWDRKGSIQWVSPLTTWTTADMNTYRARYPDLPRNEVADTLHMSGECLCGCFAKVGELDEIAYWYPEVRAEIAELEAEVRAAGIPEPYCRWGWGADRRERGARRIGQLCSSCTRR
ncbi:phosphoadenosine phosphosulfate reductase family protein [Longispora sp. NPDC051575]|uniref:phosphoadenosine phosphosulfate reductase domain-containing protein n=1 Tax=Longispora sp. NPDC051575 TaxID=3154943 RepID=UPI00343DDA37